MSGTPRYYKVLGGRTGREPIHGGSGRWKARGWMPPVIPQPCVSGYHVCTLDQLLSWVADGCAVWTVEVRGQIVPSDTKTVAAEARLVTRLAWDDRIARLYAADCAEHVLPLYEREHPNDARPRQAIEAARRYARGEIDAAARDAAWAAAWAATWDAARDAARAAASAAARAATWAAARDAARATASAAASAAERAWQSERLRRYLDGEVKR